MISSLGKRLISSAFLVSIAIFTMFFAPDWFFFLVVEGFVLLGLNEFLVLAEKKGIQINRWFGVVLGGILPFSFYFGSEDIILVVACVVIFLFNFYRRRRDQAIVSTAVTIFAVIYIAWFFSYLIKIKHLEHGDFWVFYTILLVKGGDAGAYFVGKTFGKTKLIEHISPNKSVEGAWGGFAVTVLLSLISKSYLWHAEFFHLLILGIMVGILSQLGDLSESLIKRDAGVKDSGDMPGLGGVLDVLDSLLFTVPFVYYYLTAFTGVMR
ncbi:MAG: phosphatidate cytidylyltransferase [Candidatus Omnitrophica bacterium]|nr:phosphatidate cytidylyltransferase [Candidatus Omnitrophota bacterium]